MLFDEITGRLVLLDRIAAVVWHGLNSGLGRGDVVRRISEGSGADERIVQRDVDALLDRWGDLGLLCESEGRGRIDPINTADKARRAAPKNRRIHSAQLLGANGLSHLGTFGIGDVEFELHASSPAVQQAADEVFGHLRIDRNGRCDFALTVVRRHDEWELYRNGEYVAHCSSNHGIAPMLHANTLLLAYRYSNASIALHAAAVASDKDCIIFPGASGAGKSTLSAALMLEGFRFCSDDLVLLTDSNLSVIPMSFCIGLKEGAWETVAARSPIVADLATHIREDGKAIRYLPPLSVSQTVGRSERLRARLLVFPTFDPNGRNLLNEMSPGSALVRLAESGYDVTPGLDKATLRRLIEWIESIQCVELRYDELNYAIDKIVSLATGKH